MTDSERIEIGELRRKREKEEREADERARREQRRSRREDDAMPPLRRPSEGDFDNIPTPVDEGDDTPPPVELLQMAPAYMQPIIAAMWARAGEGKRGSPDLRARVRWRSIVAALITLTIGLGGVAWKVIDGVFERSRREVEAEYKAREAERRLLEVEQRIKRMERRSGTLPHEDEP